MNLDDLESMLALRVALREEQLDRIECVARRHGATALHVFGSLGRGSADALSDIDAWLTFPDAEIKNIVRNRRGLYGEIGDVLVSHEMAPNRPPGGIYTLVLYATPVGLLQVDWYLAPQSSSRVDPAARAVFADVAVAERELPTDGEAEPRESRSERIDWLACMLFIAIKGMLRDGSPEFWDVLCDVYRHVCETYELDGSAVPRTRSLAAVGTMLGQLDRDADARQQRALRAIVDFQQHAAAHRPG